MTSSTIHHHQLARVDESQISVSVSLIISYDISCDVASSTDYNDFGLDPYSMLMASSLFMIQHYGNIGVFLFILEPPIIKQPVTNDVFRIYTKQYGRYNASVMYSFFKFKIS